MESMSFIRPANFSLFDIKRTQIEMMRDRGYPISNDEKDILSMTEHQFLFYLDQLIRREVTNEWAPYLDMINLPEDAKYTKRTLLGNVYIKNNKRCLVLFIDQVGGQQVIKVIADAIVVMTEGISTGIKYDELILITKIPFSVVSKRCISDLRYTKCWTFFDKDLILNVTKHVMVPEHTLMPEVDVRDFKRKYKHIEQISEDDPVVRYYGWQVGSIVVVRRNISEMNMMVGEMINKRIIVRSTAVNDGKK